MLGRFGALLGTAGLVYLLAVWTPGGQLIDSRLMGDGFAPLTLGLSIDALQVVRRGSLYLLAAVVAVESALALARRRWLLVIRCGLLVSISTLSASWLRRHLPRPELGDPTYPFNTFPSGHAAASAALVVAMMVLAPTRVPTVTVRCFGVVALAISAGASVATLSHRPSDVLGSLLGVAAGATLAFPEATGRDGPPLPNRLWVVLLAAVAFTVVPVLSELGFMANLAWLLWGSGVIIGVATRARPAPPA